MVEVFNVVPKHATAESADSPEGGQMALSSTRVPCTATTPHERSRIGQRFIDIGCSPADATATQILSTIIESRKGE